MTSKNKVIKSEINNNIQDFYNGFYSTKSSQWRKIGAVDKAKNISLACQNIKPNSIIEIGCGDGSLLEEIAHSSLAKELVGLDISESGIEIANLNKSNKIKEFKSFDGSRVPFEDKCFDLAILSHVVEHLEHPRQLIYESMRVAKYVFVEVPLENNFRLPKNFQFNDLGHINCYSRKTIRHLLQSCDLKILHEGVTNRSVESYMYQDGPSGKNKYRLKNFLLKVCPPLATVLFTYHGWLLCTSTDES